MLCLRNVPQVPPLVRHFAQKLEKSQIAAYQRNKDEKLMFGGLLETKKEKKKRVKRQIKEGEPLKSAGSDAPDSESYWLANLTTKDLKIYRKTSTGRYQPVDRTKVLESLAPSEESQDLSLEKTAPTPDVKPSASSTIFMPEILIKSMTQVPMLASGQNKSSPTVDFSKYPSVTKIISETMSPESKAALDRWKTRMIAELGEEGFALFNKEQLNFGARFHDCVRQHLKGCEPSVDSTLEKVWGSVSNVLDQVTNVQLLETYVHHPMLKYKGILDCVASYQNNPLLIEWKVSEKLKPTLSNTYDAPLQLTAYLGALSHNNQEYPQINNGLVVVAYKNGAPAEAFPMNEAQCSKHWNLWIKRVQSYWLSNNST